MTRLLVVILAAGLVLASAAQAKGPHAMLQPGPEAAEPGEPWQAALELNEFRRPSHVTLYARRGDRKLTATLVRTLADWRGQTRYLAKLTFPSAGRWRLYAATKSRSFAFPAIAVGSGRVHPDYVAFPEGSRAQREGAGGIMSSGPEAAPAGSGTTSLEPEVFTAASREDEGPGVPAWVFPLAGVVLAGAGIVRFRLR